MGFVRLQMLYMDFLYLFFISLWTEIIIGFRAHNKIHPLQTKKKTCVKYTREYSNIAHYVLNLVERLRNQGSLGVAHCPWNTKVYFHRVIFFFSIWLRIRGISSHNILFFLHKWFGQLEPSITAIIMLLGGLIIM